MNAVLTAAGEVPLTNERAVIGHNMSPFDAIAIDVEDAMDAARQFLDGAPIETQADADAVGKVLDLLRGAGKAADEQRKVEAKPFDDGKAAVQAKWKPLIDKAALAQNVAKRALGTFLQTEQARQDEIARLARVEADRIAEEARQAHLAAGVDLAATEQAEAALKVAKGADRDANRAEKGRAQVAGGARAVSLRSRWTATLADPNAALRHYRGAQPDALRAWLVEQAQRDVNAGARAIDGFTITESKVAV